MEESTTIYYIRKIEYECIKYIPVVNLPPFRFVGGSTNKKGIGNTHGYWDPEILLALVTAMG